MKKKAKKNTNKKYILDKRYSVLTFIVVVSFFIIVFRLLQIQAFNKDFYADALMKANRRIIQGKSSPRGKIYDRNHKLIVDNMPVKTIYYKKNKNISTKDEIELAYKIGDYLELDYSKLTNRALREFFLDNNKDLMNERITEEEYQSLNMRRITSKDILEMKIKRITDDELSLYTDKDKKAAYIYNLMNNGYSYDEKIIKNENVTDEEYAYFSENSDELKGFNVKLGWDRIYLYGEVFKSILGTVSTESQGIPKEFKDYYLKKGYLLDDKVGLSYIEYQYEDYLKGVKPKYKINYDNTYELVEEGKRGSDIVLTIDIDLQKEIERILEEEIMNAKREANTQYYNRSFVIVSDPRTGEILAMAGKQLIDGNFVDVTPGIVTAPNVCGSVVKGASITVGYKTGVLALGDKMMDSCIYLGSDTKKCSWRRLGMIDDIKALALSSNYYQFVIGLRVAGSNSMSNAPRVFDHDAFNIYRNTFKEYGLGVKTGIDLPTESIGNIGERETIDLLLNYTIGQYDTYTPMQLSQYVNTVASDGKRKRPYLLKGVYDSSSNLNKLLYEMKPEILNSVTLDKVYMDRIKQGFRQVLIDYVGRGFMGNAPEPAGKTGTSQSFVDSNGDGLVDTETISKSFVGYAPYDNPVMSVVAVSPDIGYLGNGGEFVSLVNKRLSKRVADYFFNR